MAAHTIAAVDEPLNPYSVGNSIAGAGGVGFYGREDVFTFVADALRSARRPPVVLYGQRRIGKSSVLRQLPRHLPADHVCVVFDLQGQARLPLDTLLYGLAREIALPCGLPRPAREAIRAETFAAWLGEASTALGSARRLVLLFDEFDVADVGADTDVAASSFLGFLAGLTETQPEIGIVMVVGRKLDELSETFVGAVLRNAVHHRLLRFTKEQSHALAGGLGAGTLAFEPGALERVYGLAGGQPYCTQLVCHLVWQRAVRPGRALPVPVTASAVQEALAPAVEYGTSGLGWIYDGLERPSHRLFLGALAELLAEHPERAATMVEIEQRLLRHGTLIDAAELRTTPAKLANWDVLETSPAGFRFAVPMIGLWIRLNRPLAELEAQARLANPRAWRFYELAALAQQREEWDEAIGHYRQALAANPALVDAQLGLGACLRARDGEGDLALAIEAYEQALSLDAAAPRAALLDALMQKIQRNGHDPAPQIDAWKQIAALDAGGAMHAAARRQLHHLAGLWLERRPPRVREARALFEAIADVAGLSATQAEAARQAPYARTEAVGLGSFYACFGLAWTMESEMLWSWTGIDATTLLLAQRVLTLVCVAAFGLVVSIEQRPTAWRVLGVMSGSAAIAAAAMWPGWSLLACGFLGCAAGAILAGALVPAPALPAALHPPAGATSSRPLATLALRVADALQRFARAPAKAPKES